MRAAFFTYNYQLAGMSEKVNRDRINTLFVAIGVGLVALSAVVLGGTLYLSIGLPGVSTAAPALLGTAVFTLMIAVGYWVARRVTPGELYAPRRLGR